MFSQTSTVRANPFLKIVFTSSPQCDRRETRTDSLVKKIAILSLFNNARRVLNCWDDFAFKFPILREVEAWSESSSPARNRSNCRGREPILKVNES